MATKADLLAFADSPRPPFLPEHPEPVRRGGHVNARSSETSAGCFVDCVALCSLSKLRAKSLNALILRYSSCGFMKSSIYTIYSYFISVCHLFEPETLLEVRGVRRGKNPERQVLTRALGAYMWAPYFWSLGCAIELKHLYIFFLHFFLQTSRNRSFLPMAG